jgi:hypothetical protein
MRLWTVRLGILSTPLGRPQVVGAGVVIVVVTVTTKGLVVMTIIRAAVLLSSQPNPYRWR